MVTVGFVGLGVMGASIVVRLLDAGHLVQGYNRTTAKAERLGSRGMAVAASPRAAAHGADVVFSMVSDGEALARVYSGEDGILGVVVRKSADSFIVRSEDTRVITFKLADSTLYFQGSKWASPSRNARSGWQT